METCVMLNKGVIQHDNFAYKTVRLQLFYVPCSRRTVVIATDEFKQVDSYNWTF